MYRAPKMVLTHLPFSTEARPTMVSLESAETLVFSLMEHVTDREQRFDFLSRRWPLFVSEVEDRDQVWHFETSGYGPKKRRGFALERDGYIVAILMLPDAQ